MNYDINKIKQMVETNYLTPDYIDCTRVKNHDGSHVILPIKLRKKM